MVLKLTVVADRLYARSKDGRVQCELPWREALVAQLRGEAEGFFEAEMTDGRSLEIGERVKAETW